MIYSFMLIDPGKISSPTSSTGGASKLVSTPSQDEIVPVAEPDIAPQLPAVPKTQSGCVIS